MKQFCETSSIFELDNIKNETSLRDFLIFRNWQHQNRNNSARLPSKWKVECRADGLVPMRFAIFPLHLSKVLRLPRKRDAKSWEVLHLSRKIISANLKIWCSKMQPLSRNQRPDLLTSLMNMSLALRPATENASLQILFKCPTPAIVFGNAAKPSRFAVLTRCTIPCACHAKRRFNVQKRSEPLVFLTFWLRNVLRATTACAFSTSQLRKVVRRWGVLYILTSKCASRHNGLQFFISHLASCWLRTRFSEPTFRPSGATNHWKNTVFRDFPTVPFRAPGSSFFWDFLFFDIVSSSLLFSDSSHLCFSSVHIVGSLTSKLPSMICTYSLYSLSNFKAFVCVCVCNIDPSPTHVHFFRQSPSGTRWVHRQVRYTASGWFCNGRDWEEPQQTESRLPSNWATILGSFLNPLQNDKAERERDVS